MNRRILQVTCPNFNRNNSILINNTTTIPLLTSILQGCLPVNISSLPVYIDTIESDKATDINSDFGALMYIVTVLLMYSCGIFFMIMKNLKREKHELEEERTLDDFFRGIPVSEKERELVNVNRVAIQAFYTMTTCRSQDLTDTEEMYITQRKPAKSTIRKNSVETIYEDEDEEGDKLIPTAEDCAIGSDSDSETVIYKDCSSIQDIQETII